MKTSKTIVFEYIQRCFYTDAKQYEENGIETKQISDALNMQRSNVSSLLNDLVKEGKLIKTNTRPVYYRLNEDTTAKKKENDIFDKLVGSKGSLRNVVNLAKAAVLYPGQTLNILITGQYGCGMSYFASLIYKFAIEGKVLKDSSPFIYVNCRHYSKNITLLDDDLFGSDGNLESSAFSRAQHGMLFIDNFDFLNAKQQSRIYSFLESNIITNQDNSEVEKFDDILLVVSVNSDHQADSSLMRKFPVIIPLPTLSERPLNEKVDLIHYFFMIESTNSKRTIKVERDVLAALLLTDFTYNVKELHNDIKTACANAYVRVINDSSQDILVYLSDFKPNVNSSLLKLANFRHKISELLPNEQFVLYDGDELYKGLENHDNLYLYIKHQYEELSVKGVNSSNIEYLINSHIQDLFNFYKFEDHYDNDCMSELSKIVDIHIINFVSHFLTNAEPLALGQRLNKSTFYGLCLHLNSLIMLSIDSQRTTNEQINDVIKKYPDEYLYASKFSKEFEKEFNIVIPIGEVTLIALFFIDRSSDDYNRPVLLYIMHGSSTAKSLATVTNALTHCSNSYYFDMNLKSDTTICMNEIKALIQKIDQGKGVIIIYDMGSIRTMIDEIANQIDTKIRLINVPITLIGIDIARKCAMDNDVDNVYHDALLEISNFKDPGKLPEAIITLCHTGEGGAIQIKKFIDHYSKLNIKTVPLAISNKEELYKEVLALKKIYNIHAFVGTYDPRLLGIPFISISKLFDSGKDNIDKVLMFEPLSTQIVNFDAIYQNLSEYLRFASVARIKEVVPDIVDQISVQYNLDHDQQLGLFMHLASMIERLMSNEISESVDNKDQILLMCEQDCKLIGKLLKPIEKTFKVIVNDDELATIVAMVKRI